MIAEELGKTPEEQADRLQKDGKNYGGDWATSPDGKSRYMKFQVISHPSGNYVIENHIRATTDGYYTRPVVKRLF